MGEGKKVWQNKNKFKETYFKILPDLICMLQNATVSREIVT